MHKRLSSKIQIVHKNDEYKRPLYLYNTLLFTKSLYLGGILRHARILSAYGDDVVHSYWKSLEGKSGVNFSILNYYYFKIFNLLLIILYI